MSARRRMASPWDAALLAVVLLICGALFWAAGSRGSGAAAVVEQNGTELCRIALSAGEKTVFTVPGEPQVVIAVENGEAWFESSGCPDQVCVRSGKLSKTGEAAACLPAGVVLRIEGRADQDAVTG